MGGDVKELGLAVSGDMDDAMTGLNNLGETIDNLSDKIINISVNIEDEALKDLESELELLDSSNTDVEVELIDNATDGINNIENELDTLDSESTIVDVDIIADSSQIDSVGTSLDNLSNSAETSANEISSSMDKATSSVDQLGKASEEASDKASAVGETGSKAGEDIGNSFDTAALAVIGLSVALEASARSLNDANTAFGKMSNTVGSIPEGRMRDIVAEITNVKFPEDEALDYIRTLKQLGVTTEDSLGRGATAFNTIRVGTGASEEAVVKFSNSLRVMGIDLDNIGSSFNAIAYANANIVGGFETYVAWMQKYDSTFKDMGLNIDQTAVIIAAATKKFGGGRAAYQGLNEAIKESNGDLSVLEQKLGMQPGALSRASEETAKYSGKLEKNTDTAREHTTALEQMGAMLEDVFIKYGDAISSIESIGAILLTALGVVYIGIPGALKVLDKIWDVSWAETYTKMVSSATSRLTNLGKDILNSIKSWVGWGAEAEKATSGVGEGVGKGASKSADAVFEYVMEMAKNYKGATGEAIQFMDESTGTLRTFFIDSDGSMAEVFEDGKAPYTAEQYMDDIGKGVSEGTGRSSGILGKAFDGLKTVLGKGWDGLSRLWDTFKLPELKWPEFKFPSGLTSLSENLGKVVPEILKIAGRLADVFIIITAGLTALWNAGDLFTKGGIVSGVLEILGVFALLRDFGFGDAVESFRQFEIRMTGTVKDMMDKLFGKGFSDLILNFWQGVQDTFRGLGIDFSSMESTVRTGVNAIIELITLPFKDIMAEGPAQWINRIFTQLSEYLAPVKEMIGERLAGIPDLINGIIDTLLFNLGSGLKSIYEFVINLGNAIVNLPATIQGLFDSGSIQVQIGIKKMQDFFTSGLAWLGQLPGNLYLQGQNLIGKFIEGLKAKYEELKKGVEGVSQRVQDGLNYIYNLPTTLRNLAVDSWNKFIQGIKDKYGEIRASIDNAVNQVRLGIQWFLDLPGNMYNWGFNTIKSWKEGIESWINTNWAGFKAWLNDRAKSLFGGWESHSPPVEGPLMDIDKWGGNLALTWIEGIAEGLTDNRGILDSALKLIQSPFNLDNIGIPENQLKVINETIANANSPTTIEQEISYKVEISLEGATINSKEDAEEIGDTVGASFVKRVGSDLSKEMIDKGESPINVYR